MSPRLRVGPVGPGMGEGYDGGGRTPPKSLTPCLRRRRGWARTLFHLHAVTLFVSTKSYTKRPASVSPVPKDKADSLARVRPQGPPGDSDVEQAAVLVSSGFRIPPAVLPEEIPAVAEVFLSEIPLVETATDVSSTDPSAVTVYKPPLQTGTLLGDAPRVETHEDLLNPLPAWRPLKKVFQEDLDQTLGPEAP